MLATHMLYYSAYGGAILVAGTYNALSFVLSSACSEPRKSLLVLLSARVYATASLPAIGCCLMREGAAQVALSLCDGNTFGAHIVGDLLCLLLAAAQVPWLCPAPSCPLWLQASTAVWLLAQARRSTHPDALYAWGECSLHLLSSWAPSV